MGKRGFFSWLVGFLTGTFFGFLFAPRKGKDTRDRIKKSREDGGFGHEPVLEDVKKLGEEISKTASEVYRESALQDYIDGWRKRLSDLSEGLISDVTDFRKYTVKPIQKNIKKKVREGKIAVRRGRGAAKRAYRMARSMLKKKK